MIGQDNFILVWMENISLSKGSPEKLELRVDSGDYVNISGLSGHEKMNFINLLGCLQKPSTGKYLFDYKDLGMLDQRNLNVIRREMGFLFSNLNLMEKLSVAKNIEMPVLFMHKGAREAVVKKAAEQLGVAEQLETPVKKLSELEQHKVALARAIVANPAMLIADEPASGLGEAACEEILELLTQINRRGTAVVSFSEKQRQQMNAGRQIYFREGRFMEETRGKLGREAVL